MAVKKTTFYTLRSPLPPFRVDEPLMVAVYTSHESQGRRTAFRHQAVCSATCLFDKVRQGGSHRQGSLGCPIFQTFWKFTLDNAFSNHT